MTAPLIFQCSICGEESTRICARCTKDACDNHICAKCLRCSDCCECEVALDDAARPVVRPSVEESGAPHPVVGPSVEESGDAARPVVGQQVEGPAPVETETTDSTLDSQSS